MTRSHPNNAVQKRQRRARLLHSVYSWHRWLGLSVMLWVVIFAVSGLLIEASPALGLDKRLLQNQQLLKHYNVKAAQPIAQWRTSSSRIDVWDQGISLNGEWLQRPSNAIPKVNGLVEHNNLLLLADGQQLLIYDRQGQYIDQLPSPAGRITQLGISQQGEIAITSEQGFYLSDASLLAWQLANEEPAAWSRAIAADGKLRPPSLHDISYERLLLDIHSGALFGPVGRWLSRLAAFLMLLLAASGFYTWFSRFARKH